MCYDKNNNLLTNSNLFSRKESAMELKGKIDELLDKTEIDDKIIEGAQKLKEKVDEVLEKTEIDDKIKEVAQNIKEKLTD